MALTMHSIPSSLDTYCYRRKMADHSRASSPFTSGYYSPSHLSGTNTGVDYFSSAADMESLMASTDERIKSYSQGANVEPQGRYLGDAEHSGQSDVDFLEYALQNLLRFFTSSFGCSSGIMAHIPSMYNTVSSNAHIRSAVSALTLEKLGLENASSEILAQSQAEYGRTLLRVRDALGDATESRKDETLATIQLLCHFEFLRSVTDNQPFTYTHGDAVPLLLKHRGAEQLDSDRSRRIFLCFQTRLLMYCIDRGYSIEDMLGDLSEIPEIPGNPIEQLMSMAREVNRLQLRINLLKQATSRDQKSLLTGIQEILKLARDVDSRLHRWSVCLDSHWHYSLMDADEVIIEPNRYSEQIHIYPNLRIARVWNGWRTIRINLQIARNDLLNWASASLNIDLPQERRHCHGIAQVVVDEVCNSVHYSLGNRTRLDPDPIAEFPPNDPDDPYEMQTFNWGWFHLLMPLRTCARAPALLPKQRQWIHHSLIRISKIASLRKVAETPTKPPILMTEPLPSNAFSIPVFPFENEALVNPVSGEWDQSQFGNRSQYSPAPSSEGYLPSQRAQNVEMALPYSQLSSASSSSRAVSSPPTKHEQNQQIDLPFFNTTRPDQIKDPDIQKKIRRDVMINYVRNQDPKQREERARNARAGSAAKAASRREQSASLSRERRDSGGEASSSNVGKQKKGLGRRMSSKKGKDKG